MPYVAKIRRDGPFRSADRPEIEAMVKRIARGKRALRHRGLAGGRRSHAFPFHDLGEARAIGTGSTAQVHASAAAKVVGPQLGLGDGTLDRQ